MKAPRSLVLMLLIILQISCVKSNGLKGATAVTQENAPTVPNANRVSVMTFNVENLFDTSHDVGKNDHTYLPRSAKQNDAHRARCAEVPVQRWRDQCLYWDWTEEIVEYKLRRIADVIASVNNGRGPDIIAFQEVENIHILERLRDDFLVGTDYLKPVLIEGEDLRGIDVAFISRFELARAPQLHSMAFQKIEQKQLEDTRGILQADFILPDGSELTGFAVHFPAPFHPWPLRVASYQRLNELLARLPLNRAAFAAGDFNTPSEEDREHKLLDRYVTERWHLAHQEGCAICPGTYYYAPKKEWSFLDMIIVRRNTTSAWRLNAQGTQLVNRLPVQSDEAGYPARFEQEPLSGVSDHWPLMIELIKH